MLGKSGTLLKEFLNSELELITTFYFVSFNFRRKISVEYTESSDLEKIETSELAQKMKGNTTCFDSVIYSDLVCPAFIYLFIYILDKLKNAQSDTKSRVKGKCILHHSVYIICV